MKEKKEIIQVRVSSELAEIIDEFSEFCGAETRTGAIRSIFKQWKAGTLAGNTGNTKQARTPKTQQEKARDELERKEARLQAELERGREICRQMGGKVDETNKTCRFVKYQYTGMGHVVRMPQELGLKVIPDDMPQIALQGKPAEQWEKEWQAQDINPDANRTPADK